LYSLCTRILPIFSPLFFRKAKIIRKPQVGFDRLTFFINCTILSLLCQLCLLACLSYNTPRRKPRQLHIPRLLALACPAFIRPIKFAFPDRPSSFLISQPPPIPLHA
jgi:hypothetical protein